MNFTTYVCITFFVVPFSLDFFHCVKSVENCFKKIHCRKEDRKNAWEKEMERERERRREKREREKEGKKDNHGTKDMKNQ